MAAERASTGIAGLDQAVDGLRLGDNVVWQVDDLDAFRTVLDPFVAQSRAEGRRILYVRFAEHPPLVTDDDIEVHRLDPSRGFEHFAARVHDLIEAEGRRAFYLFDSLTELLDAWHSDLMVMNLFKVTCPFLYELDTIAYFALMRSAHTNATVAGIRETTQLLLDLHVTGDATFVHPLKVDQRSSPTMFFPHRIDAGSAVPVTASEASARLMSPLGRLTSRTDRWQQIVEDAHAALDADDETRARLARQLCDVMVGRDGRMVELAHRHLTLADLVVVASREVGTGRIGGKSVGMLVARAILDHDPEGRFAGHLEPHDSFYVGADAFYTFLVANGWWAHRLRQRTPDGFLAAGAELHREIPGGAFPTPIRDQFRLVLEHFGQAPIIVRSSSLLEDNFGNAFAGKYDSFFLANQGTPEGRLAALEDAVRAVYASAMSEEALRYRQARGLAEADEQMAILIQRVSGDHHARYFFPHAAGVGNSSNLYVWDPDIDGDAGMLRLVLGMGTRAVDRTGTDHARIVALDSPTRGRLAADEVAANSQRFVDVLDLAEDAPATVPVSALQGLDLAADWSLFASPDLEARRRLAERGRRPAKPPVIVDFAGLLTQTPFPAVMKNLLKALSDAYDYPVDVEFTVNITADGEPRINLVQCRPLQTRGPGSAVAMPCVTDAAGVLFSSDGEFMGGNVRLSLTHVVAVRPEAYLALGQADRHAVARQVGVLNRALKGEPFLLLGPGRWGTTTEALGVPARFAEISNAAVLVEATYAAGEFRPELSYGSHFFQDLVETGIFYCALFDDRRGVTFRPDVVTSRPNVIADLDPATRLADVVHVARFDDLELYSDVVAQRVLCCRTSAAVAI